MHKMCRYSTDILRMLFISVYVHWVSTDTKTDICFGFVWCFGSNGRKQGIHLYIEILLYPGISVEDDIVQLPIVVCVQGCDKLIKSKKQYKQENQYCCLINTASDIGNFITQCD